VYPSIFQGGPLRIVGRDVGQHVGDDIGVVSGILAGKLKRGYLTCVRLGRLIHWRAMVDEQFCHGRIVLGNGADQPGRFESIDFVDVRAQRQQALRRLQLAPLRCRDQGMSLAYVRSGLHQIVEQADAVMLGGDGQRCALKIVLGSVGIGAQLQQPGQRGQIVISGDLFGGERQSGLLGAIALVEVGAVLKE
jgi:hypothetical protein